jgi:hypothetical protein
LEDALDALLKSAPPLDFAPPPPEAPPPFFMRRPEGEEPPLPFAATPAGGGTEDVLSPNPPEMTGIDPLAGLTGDAREPDPNAAPQAFVRPQIPPPPAPAIPDLPDDGPQGPALDDDGDFLKMFPGVGG